MKLFYYKTESPSRNFGDEINPWLWPRLIPWFDSCKRTVFVGIGTMLNNAIPQWIGDAENVIFFSTGAGYGNRFRPKRQPNWHIYCVRGPLSAQRLTLPSRTSITDGAALLKRYFPAIATTQRTYPASYMPHFRHGNPQLFREVCKQTGIHYIDPANDVEEVIADISQSQLLISEAMHGAIVADTLRVPWIPVRTNPRILPFKWQDWCASIGQPYQPQIIRGAQSLSYKDYLYSTRLYLQGQSSIKSLFSNLTMNHWKLFSQPVSLARLDALSEQLLAITHEQPYLSHEDTLERLITRLEICIHQFNQDCRQGVFL
ncbi:MAG: polysaccharide pyruvyl transferase family protein [Cyanobacteria bacterium J06621_11]